MCLCIGPRAWVDVSSGASSLLSGGLYIGFVTTLHSVCACVLALVLACAIWCQQSSSIRWPYFTRVLQPSYYVVRVCTYALVLVLYNHVSLSSSVSKNNDKFGSYMYEYIV